MKLKNLRLTLSNVTNRKELEVVETSVNRVRLDNGALGKDVDTYSLHCCAYHGDILKVKVGKQLAEKVTKLNNALSDDVIVLVTFTGLKLKAYAMRGSGDNAIISGVTASADDFDFKVRPAEDEDIEIDL